jgi:hypothetical protein
MLPIQNMLDPTGTQTTIRARFTVTKRALGERNGSKSDPEVTNVILRERDSSWGIQSDPEGTGLILRERDWSNGQEFGATCSAFLTNPRETAWQAFCVPIGIILRIINNPMPPYAVRVVEIVHSRWIIYARYHRLVSVSSRLPLFRFRYRRLSHIASGSNWISKSDPEGIKTISR